MLIPTGSVPRQVLRDPDGNPWVGQPAVRLSPDRDGRPLHRRVPMMPLPPSEGQGLGDLK
jgi:streptogramin lyase